MSNGTPTDGTATSEPGTASAEILEQPERKELERIAGGAAEIAKLLEDLGSDGLEEALAAVSEARYQLELTERRLVRVARRAGRSWAQIGIQLGITTGNATRERFNRNQ